jgi:DNA-directed RNA polymerase specialized sigma24 family protein
VPVIVRPASPAWNVPAAAVIAVDVFVVLIVAVRGSVVLPVAMCYLLTRGYNVCVPSPAKTEAEFRQRFWEKVNRTPDCWTWTGAANRTGYGSVRRRPHMYAAHRLSYEFAYGPIPEGLWVLHRCDNPPCVRPDHLFLGTQRENNEDCSRKQRRRRIGTAGAKLTELYVRQIRSLYIGGLTQREIAERFAVTQVTVSNVIRGRTYNYVR